MITLTLLIILAMSVTLTGQICLKKGIIQVGVSHFGDLRAIIPYFRALLMNPFAVFGALCAAAGALLWLIVLSKGELSFLLPLAGAVFYILLLLCSQFILREHVDAMRWLGVLVIIVGVLIISYK